MAAPSAAFLAATLAWVSQVTGFTIPTPQIQLIERDCLPPRNAETSPGVVKLNAEWDARSIEDQCILAHELVHVGQFAARLKFKSVDEMEPLAYAVEHVCRLVRGDKEEAIGWTYTSETVKARVASGHKLDKRCARRSAAHL